MFVPWIVGQVAKIGRNVAKVGDIAVVDLGQQVCVNQRGNVLVFEDNQIVLVTSPNTLYSFLRRLVDHVRDLDAIFLFKIIK